MTTFTFVDQEYTTSSANTGYLTPRSVYTVPSGKIARIKMDSVNLSTNGSTYFSQGTFILFSDGANVHRKHMYGYYSTGRTDTATIGWYNPADFGGMIHAENGTSTIRYNAPMNTQPGNWVLGGTVESNISTSMSGEGYWTSTNGYGGICFGPSSFFMKAGEVLKLAAAADTDASTAKYVNARLAIWLEDE